MAVGSADAKRPSIRSAAAWLAWPVAYVVDGRRMRRRRLRRRRRHLFVGVEGRCDSKWSGLHPLASCSGLLEGETVFVGVVTQQRRSRCVQTPKGGRWPSVSFEKNSNFRPKDACAQNAHGCPKLWQMPGPRPSFSRDELFLVGLSLVMEQAST